MRNYVPDDDELEVNDFDEYYDIPARTAKDLAARVYIKIERDTERARHLRERELAVMLEFLRWARDYRAQLRMQEDETPHPGWNE